MSQGPSSNPHTTDGLQVFLPLTQVTGQGMGPGD